MIAYCPEAEFVDWCVYNRVFYSLDGTNINSIYFPKSVIIDFLQWCASSQLKKIELLFVLLVSTQNFNFWGSYVSGKSKSYNFCFLSRPVFIYFSRWKFTKIISETANLILAHKNCWLKNNPLILVQSGFSLLFLLFNTTCRNFINHLCFFSNYPLMEYN